MNKELASLPGFADVFSAGNLVSAVVSAPTTTAFVVLEYDEEKKGYSLHQEPKKWEFDHPGHPDYTDTYVSLTRDVNATWWITYLRGGRVWTVASENSSGTKWYPPFQLGKATTGWDKAVLFPTRSGVGAMWSYQRDGDDAMSYRFHLNGDPVDHWSATETLAIGPEAAEDHFNVATAPDGTVYVSTMDDHNVIGDSPLVLRILGDAGSWQSVLFAKLTREAKPTRAILLGGGDPWQLYIVHNRLVKGDRVRGEIVLRCTRQNDFHIDSQTTPILSWPQLDIRDPTSTRDTLPPDADWLVLASDRFGNIYEGRFGKDQCAESTI